MVAFNLRVWFINADSGFTSIILYFVRSKEAVWLAGERVRDRIKNNSKAAVNQSKAPLA